MKSDGKLLRTVVIREYERTVHIECDEHTAMPATVGLAHKAVNQAATLMRINNLNIFKSLNKKSNDNHKKTSAQKAQAGAQA